MSVWSVTTDSGEHFIVNKRKVVHKLDTESWADFWNLLCLLDFLLLCFFFQRIEVCDPVLLCFENKSKQCKQEISRFRITNLYNLTKYFFVIPENELSGEPKALFNYRSIAYIVHHPIGYYELMFKLFYAFKQ